MTRYKRLAKGLEKDALLALQKFVAIDSVYDANTITSDAPYGAGVKKALDYVAKLGEDYGFAIDKCDGRATELTIGESGPLISIFAHADVVPASGKWSNPPFSPTLKDGRLWGRGTSDDKGPLIAAFYAIKALKDAGLISKFRVRLVAGGDEERGSSCLEYYFHKLNKEAPKFGFTPDSEFPLVYGEKAMKGAIATRILDLAPIINMDGGVVSNAVCDSLVVTIKHDQNFVDFFKEQKISGDISSAGLIDIVTFKGKSSHGSLPEKGINAALLAFETLGNFYNLEALKTLATSLKDPNGRSFGGYCHSPELGDTTYNYGIIKYDGHVLKMTVDFRFGENTDPNACIKSLETASKMSVTIISSTDKLLFDRRSSLVSTLMKAYRKETHDYFSKPMAIGGGTYAKEAPNTVAFGSAFKGHDGSIHAPDEYIYIDDFNKQIAIYARAILALGKASK